MKILTFNSISPLAAQTLGDAYTLSDNIDSPEAIMLRAYKLTDYVFPKSVKIVTRCGAGVNNIPTDRCAEEGIIVCNTPGANANAVKELVLSSLFMCGRRIIPAINWVQGTKDGETTVQDQVEKGKSKFVGHEITGKTLGIIGLGGIGKKVAVAAMALGMKVLYFEARDVTADADYPQGVTNVTLQQLYQDSDFITIHVPLLDSTRGMINATTIATMKDGVNIINIARGELVADDDIITAVKSGKVNRYCTDFPNAKLLGIDGIVTTPHLGASTPEAEDNCAVIAAEVIKEFNVNKNVVFSVNFPSLSMATKGHAVLALFKGDGEQFAQVGKSWKLHNFQIKSNGKFGVAKFDFKEAVSADIFANINGILRIYM
ncbi:MAG: 3-phosphoglycerate dehydrogenase [Clostridia bacterium]